MALSLSLSLSLLIKLILREPVSVEMIPRFRWGAPSALRRER